MRITDFRFPVSVVAVLTALLMGSSSLLAQVPDELEGRWIMDDFSPALITSSNSSRFNIIRATPVGSKWADGQFFLKWPSAARPERGYYSLKTGRVWLTTYRKVNQKEERVEYRGVVKRNKAGDIVWTGTAKTTGRNVVTWEFEAIKG